MTLEESQEIELFLDLLLCHFEEVMTRSIYTDRDNEIWGVLVFVCISGIETEKVVINKRHELTKIIPFLRDNGYIKGVD